MTEPIRNDKKMLHRDALTENLMWPSALPSLRPQALLLEEKVKKVNMGRMKKEGWIRKVLSILECHVEMRAMMRPGNRTTAKVSKVVRPQLLVAVSN